MKQLFIIITFFIIFSLNSLDKPLFKTGMNSLANMLLDKNQSIYPTTLKDIIYMSISESFSDYFTFKYKIEFDYANYNKFCVDINDLTSCTFNNYISLIFNPTKNNQILLYTKPGLIYESGEKYFSDTNKIQYRLNVQNFSFITYYSNHFKLKPNELLYHKFNLTFYWNIPEKDNIKFKSSFFVLLQNNIYESEKIISPLKSLAFTFEMAIDFNKINFEDIFDEKEVDESF